MKYERFIYNKDESDKYFNQKQTEEQFKDCFNNHKETEFIEPIEESMSPREYLDCLIIMRKYLEMGKEEEIEKIKETFNIYAEPIEIKIRNLTKMLCQ